MAEASVARDPRRLDVVATAAVEVRAEPVAAEAVAARVEAAVGARPLWWRTQVPGW